MLRSPLFGLLRRNAVLAFAASRTGSAAGLFDANRCRRSSTTRPAAAGRVRRGHAPRPAGDEGPPAGRPVDPRGPRRGPATTPLLLAEFLGERKLANLHKLIEQARSFDRAGIFTLSDFITQLSEFVARQPDEPLAATHPESTDVVKLMSIHQSKGLEFPVVVVPDVGRPRRARGLGRGLHAATGADGSRTPTPPAASISA